MFLIMPMLQVVHSRFNQLIPAEIKSGFNPDLVRPDEEEVQQVGYGGMTEY